MASSSPPLQKKQQSISKFFSKGPAGPTPPPRIERKETTPIDKENAPEESLFVQEDSVENAVRTKSGGLNGVSLVRSRKRKSVLESDDEGDNEGTTEEHTGTATSLNVPPTAKRSRSNAPAEADRTTRFMFSSPVEQSSENPDEVEEHRKLRERLHQKFVKKLGRPESLAELRRRNGVLNDDASGAAENDEEEGDDDEQDQEAPPPKARGRVAAPARKTKDKLTPLQRQVIDLKRKHPDAILVVEAGYKYKIFGEDARIAARELAIVCIPGKMRFDEHPSEAHLDKFASASFPTHRLHVHVKRLVSAGHKVGIVRQLETAALKAVGNNRNKIFERGLTNLYTKGTYIDDEDGLGAPVAGSRGGAPATGHLLCLTESLPKGFGSDEKVQIGIVAVQPSTGDIIYDDFEDGWMRGELETRLLHISPCEFLIVGDVSKATEKLVQHLSGGDDARLERVAKPKTMAALAYSHITKFYADKQHADYVGGSQLEISPESGTLLDKAHRLSENATICLSAMITHLTDYGLQHVFDLTKCFQSFSARAHMLLNGNTLTSLEIYRNQTDQSERGSLFWTLNRTQTRFGQRLLRKWVGRPLLDRNQLDARIAAVEELKDESQSLAVERIKNLLGNIRGDLERTLIRIYYKKCTRSELLSLLQTLQMLAQEYAHVTDAANAGFKSQLLAEAIVSLPGIADDVVKYLDRINAQAAKADDKYNFFRDEYETEGIIDHKVGIIAVEHELQEFKATAAEKLKRKKVEYVTVAEIEYLIELDNANLKNVPASWVKISGTKRVSRYHPPEVIKLVRERDQHKEALSNACEAAFTNLLAEIGSQYQAFRDCIQSLALLDCLLSLTEIASQPGYCKPTFSDEPGIAITAGRHPMVEQLLLDPFVPNDIHLSANATRALLITGPNMGGKSSYVRSVALIAIMAQIGSYVPAESAHLGLLDAVFTRMGAFDNMLKGESTFMVELAETAHLIKHATSRSLVILDELGRGTSTHDGVAIAHAVLDHLVHVPQCLTLFITHYQTLARLARNSTTPTTTIPLQNVHMRFVSSRPPNATSLDPEVITFLYQVGEGVAHRSYGLNVARLAGLPPALLDEAARRSRYMEVEESRRRLTALARLAGPLIGGAAEGEGEGAEQLGRLVAALEQL